MNTKHSETLLSQNINQAIEVERIKVLYEHLGVTPHSYYAWYISLFTVMYLSGAHFFWLSIWVIAIVAIQIIQRRNEKTFSKLKTIDNAPAWERHIMTTVAFEALIVSTGMMLSLDLDQNLLAYTGVAMIIIPAYLSVVPLVASIYTQRLWILLMLIPVVIKFLISGEILGWLFGAVLLIAGVPIAILLGKQLNETLIDTLRLRYENTELLAVAQSEKQRAESEAKRAESEAKRAEKASADKTRFLASASHDLRQPIHALELFTDALENELDKPIQRELMEKVKESTAAMNGLLYSLLDISRLDANLINVNKEAISVKYLLEKLIAANQSTADSKKILIHLECSQCAVDSDATLLESILQNLLENALKYTDKGSITIKCWNDSEKVKISIQDTGIGISESNQTDVFSEFFQVGNSERDRSKGLGLGLSIVSRTCELLDHKLHLQSEEGKGSTFTIELGVADMNNVEKKEEVQLNLNKLNAKVLVIDDERPIREGMEKMLTPWGCEVLLAESESEAIVLLEEHQNRCDIIIADYRLADGKLGTDAVSAIHKVLLNKDVPAIIITGDTGPEQLRDVQLTGYYLIHKPITAMRLRALMKNLLK